MTVGKMSNTDQLGLKDLIALTGAKTRTLQFWSDHGVLQASADTDKQGRGAHRRYAKQEALIALIAVELDRFKIPVGELLRISQRIRNSLNSYLAASRASDADALTAIMADKFAIDAIRQGWCISQAIYGNTVSYLLVMPMEGGIYATTAITPNHDATIHFGALASMRERLGSLDSVMTSLPEGISSALLVRLDTAFQPYRDKLLSRIIL